MWLPDSTLTRHIGCMNMQLASAVVEELVHQTAPSRLDYIKQSFQVCASDT